MVISGLAPALGSLILTVIPGVILGSLIARVEAKTPRAVSARGTVSSPLLGIYGTLAGLVTGIAVFNFLPWPHPFLYVALILLAALLGTARLARRTIGGPLAAALGATLGVSLYNPIFFMTGSSYHDPDGFWLAGIIVTWVLCGVPLFLGCIPAMYLARRAGANQRANQRADK
ncbi:MULTISPECIES: hypothetical protein [unclassified Corynebacterium]|uniref:hypothetical protein n=1 Tax=unclassified Corynebacterium TaxID=2624378 RepID=UPI0029C9C063|nr:MULTISPECIES: hypothetical protein [unclassified Corynebacterium]WPF66633.1 hypothetical protein OLX12_02555 [Corynebacterium sp. 22KM0430]WPF69121.1 hypothetical protein OLW90_02550 [Corynebacterium sp. 21KM1197]